MEAQALQFFIACVTAAGFGIAIAAFGCGIGQGMGLKSVPLKVLPAIPSPQVKSP
jgi:hypothetical protein